MAILTLVLGSILFFAGLGSLAASVDLLPTEMGRLYVECGALALCAASIVWAIALLIFRLDRIVAPPRDRARRAEPAAEPSADAAPAEDRPAPADDNRAGRLPTLREVEDAVAEPEAAPKAIGRYAAGGANYVIYADGAIEAETEHGGMRFASMEELKAYIARGGR